MNEAQTAIGSTSLILHGVLAFAGGLVHALNKHRLGQTKGIADLAMLTLISSFSGTLFFLLALHLFPDYPYLTAAAAGAGGYLGIEGLTLVAAKVRDIILK